MKKAIIIIIGTEVLSGHTQDTNSYFLAKELNKRGIFLEKIITIHDNQETLREILNYLFSNDGELKWILLTGGLGPTYDDATAKALAYSLELKYELNQEALQMVKLRYKQLKEEDEVSTSEITEAREKMAWLPNGTIPLFNSVGTAPGLFLEIQHNKTNEKIMLFSLPGVPQEMKTMFKKEVLPQIISETTLYTDTVEVKISGESMLAPVLDKIHEKFPEIYIKSMPVSSPKKGVIKVIFEYRTNNTKKAEKKVKSAINDFHKQLKKRKQDVE